MKKFLLYSLLILLQTQLWAYTFTVEGFVRDQNNQPMVQHEVLSFSPDFEGSKKTTTNNNGYYQFVYQVDGSQELDVIIYAHHWRNSELIFQHRQFLSAPGTVQFDMQLFKDNSPAPACAANFIPYLFASGHSLAFFNASMADSIISYHWDFGDGDQSTYSSPVHHYGLNQRALVTLKITTLDACNSEISYLVVFSQDDDFTLNVQLEAVPLPDGKAFIFQPIIGQNSYTIYEAPIVAGSVNLWSIPANQTYLWTNPAKVSDEYVYPTYFPTYLGASLKWQNAEVIDYQDLPQELTLLNYPDPYFGNGEIHGKVIRNDNPTQGFEYFYSLPDNSPGPDNNFVYSVKYERFPCTLFLENDQHQTIAFRQPDSLGEFHFSHLPIGSYTLRTEIFKNPAESFVITLEDQAPVSPFYNITVSNSTIFVSAPEINASNFMVFPQPAHNQLKIQVPDALVKAWVNLYTLQGEKIQGIYLNGENQLNLDLSTLYSGAYIIEIQSNSQLLRKKIIKL